MTEILLGTGIILILTNLVFTIYLHSRLLMLQRLTGMGILAEKIARGQANAGSRTYNYIPSEIQQ